jgi:hypothetical protein
MIYAKSLLAGVVALVVAALISTLTFSKSPSLAAS